MNSADSSFISSDHVRVVPAKRIQGELRLPGDKSISHRAAIIACLAHHGTSRITNFSTSEDCQSTLRCLEQLGVNVRRDAPTTICIEGIGSRGFSPPSEPLNCGNSGSTMRMLAGALAGHDVVATLTGDESLLARPMKRIIEPLNQMGAHVMGTMDCAPLTVMGRQPLRAIHYEMPVASAQVKSAILLAGLNANGRTEIIEPNVTRDHTERLLRWFGVDVDSKTLDEDGTNRPQTTIAGPPAFEARDVAAPGDLSSAAFFIAAGAVLPGSQLQITNVGLNPTRTRFLSILQLLGAHIEVGNVRDKCNEPIGDVYVEGAEDLKPLQPEANLIRGPLIPQLIDELPILAVLATRLLGGIEIRDARELRLKESDRIASTVRNLRAMGAEVEEFADGLTVNGPTQLREAVVDSFGDHRIAMAFSVAAFLATGDSEIKGADCVSVSCPEFFQLLESVSKR